MSSPADAKYRVVLTGELLPGVSREAAVRELAQLFQSPVDVLRQLLDGVSHPVDQAFDASGAAALQAQLQRIGVISRIERLSAGPVDLRLLRPGDAPPPTASDLQAGLMRCPACGHEQTVAPSCAACGVNFEAYNRQRRQAGPGARAAPAAQRPGHRAMPASERWRPGHDDFEDDVPSEQAELKLFIGPHAGRYLRVFERFGSGLRPRFALGWNWSAVLSPFLWMLHRKIWPWALVTLFTEVLAPVILLILAGRGVLPAAMDQAGWLLLLLNRLFWPAIADYLYFRHVNASIYRLHRMSPTRAHELELLGAGGVSATAVVIGVALASVFSLFLWSIVDSLDIEQPVFAPVEDALPPPLPVSGEGAGRAPAAEPLASLPPAESKWVTTRGGLRSLGAQISSWLNRAPAGTDPTQLTEERLRTDLAIAPEELRDGWGGAIRYVPDRDGFQLISAGPDQVLDTADDIQYRQVVRR
jgi:hypothetical protein